MFHSFSDSLLIFFCVLCVGCRAVATDSKSPTRCSTKPVYDSCHRPGLFPCIRSAHSMPSAVRHSPAEWFLARHGSEKRIDEFTVATVIKSVFIKRCCCSYCMLSTRPYIRNGLGLVR